MGSQKQIKVQRQTAKKLKKEEKLKRKSEANLAGDGNMCSNTCDQREDDYCDDGGEGSEFALCDLGTDCIDCGAREGDGEYESSLLEKKQELRKSQKQIKEQRQTAKKLKKEEKLKRKSE